MKKTEITDALLFRFFAGQTSNEETDRISAWLGENPGEHQEHLNRVHDLFVLSVMSEPDPESVSRPGLMSRLLRGGLLRRAAAIAAALFVAFGGSYLFYAQRVARLSERLTSIEAPAGQHIRIALNDGTTVELNARSRISYPAAFTGKERRVRLEGEARFDVEHDAGRPFVVETFACDVEVLGTEFNVKAYKASDFFETSLLEGCVELRDANDKPLVRMKPNERVVAEHGTLQKELIPDMNYFRWREGLFCFDNETIGDLIQKLQLYYDVHIVVKKPSLMKYRYSGKFRIKDGVEHVLKVLQLKHAFRYQIDDETNTITIE